MTRNEGKITKKEFSTALKTEYENTVNNTNKNTSTIGTGTLSTVSKQLIPAINEVFQSGVDAKNKVVNAINNNGGSANNTMNWDTLIGLISANGCNYKYFRVADVVDYIKVNCKTTQGNINITINGLDLNVTFSMNYLESHGGYFNPWVFRECYFTFPKTVKMKIKTIQDLDHSDIHTKIMFPTYLFELGYHVLDNSDYAPWVDEVNAINSALTVYDKTNLDYIVYGCQTGMNGKYKIFEKDIVLLY